MVARRRSKRIMRAFQLNEISAVDIPAQEGALFTLAKRHKSDDPLADGIVKRYVDPMDGAKTFSEILECFAEDKKYSEIMEVAWPKVSALDTALRSIIADKKLEVADKHTAMRSSVEGFLALIREDMPEVEEVLDKALHSEGKSSKRKAKAMVKGVVSRKARKQDDEEFYEDDEEDEEAKPVTAKQLAKFEAKLTKQGEMLKEVTEERDALKAKLDLQEQIAALDEPTRKFYQGLPNDKAKAEFLELDETMQRVMMRKAATGDEEIVVDGHTIKKSAVGPNMFAMFKSQMEKTEALKKQVDEETDKRVEAELKKRIDDEMEHLPGKPEEKLAMLKALAKLPKEASDLLTAIFKAANEKAAPMFERLGTNGRVQKGAGDQANSAVAIFEKKINEVAARDKLNKQAAMRQARREFPDEFAAYQAEGKATQH